MFSSDTSTGERLALVFVFVLSIAAFAACAGFKNAVRGAEDLPAQMAVSLATAIVLYVLVGPLAGVIGSSASAWFVNKLQTAGRIEELLKQNDSLRKSLGKAGKDPERILVDRPVEVWPWWVEPAIWVACLFVLWRLIIRRDQVPELVRDLRAHAWLAALWRFLAILGIGRAEDAEVLSAEKRTSSVATAAQFIPGTPGAVDPRRRRPRVFGIIKPPKLTPVDPQAGPHP